MSVLVLPRANAASTPGPGTEPSHDAKEDAG